jgi:hypothetical protein
MWTIVCSVFGENHVPCTLKTESETKSSPGFSIDIISDILSEWMLPFLTPNELFSQLYHMTGAICISAICEHILWICIVLTYWNVWLVHWLEHIILNLKHIYTACFAEKQSLVWRNRHSDPWSTALDTVTIAPHFTTDVVQAYRTYHPTANCFSNGNVHILIFWKKLDSLCTILAILFKPFGFITP